MKTPAHITLIDEVNHCINAISFINSAVMSDDFNLDENHNGMAVIIDMIETRLQRAIID
jgi:hypothetical protein